MRVTTDSLIRPFRALRPAPGLAGEVAVPPYDVLTTEEARRRADGVARSFLHVSRAEIDLAPDVDPHTPGVYRRAQANLESLVRTGSLLQDTAPGLFACRITSDGHVQQGVAAIIPLPRPRFQSIRRHEETRPDKVADRARLIEALNAQTGPILFAHRPDPDIDRLIDAATRGREADSRAVVDDAEHAIWVLADRAVIAALTNAFDRLGTFYVADGHHRLDATTLVAEAGRPHEHEDARNYVLGVSFPADQLRILGYHRIVRDLDGLSPAEFLTRLDLGFVVAAMDTARPPRAPGSFGLYIAGQWYGMETREPLPPGDDIVGRLDVSILAERILAPILGIEDVRQDRRVEFVGGRRGLEALEMNVDSGEFAAGFALYPTAMEDLMAVADAGGVMPPKSTWFDPKLADGLVTYVLE